MPAPTRASSRRLPEVAPPRSRGIHHGVAAPHDLGPQLLGNVGQPRVLHQALEWRWWVLQGRMEPALQCSKVSATAGARSDG